MSAKNRRQGPPHRVAIKTDTVPLAPAAEPTPEQESLLELLVSAKHLTSESLQRLVCSIDSHDVLAKVFLLEGTPYVFETSPMKYMIFREQVADRFDVGYQDVCIVGSAKLGFSPSPSKYGKSFAAESDVDVVIISEEMFDKGTLRLFEVLNHTGPAPSRSGDRHRANPSVTAVEWELMKGGIRNYVYQNFNPGLLPLDDPLRVEVFSKIRSTAPLFMALEPKVFVSKIRCRFFRNWKAAEGYYSNTLRQLARQFRGEFVEADTEEVEEESAVSPRATAS